MKQKIESISYSMGYIMIPLLYLAGFSIIPWWLCIATIILINPIIALIYYFVHKREFDAEYEAELFAKYGIDTQGEVE